MEKVKSYIILLYVIIAAILTIFYLPALGQTSNATPRKIEETNTVDLLTWPEASQFAAIEMRGKYGKPDVESDGLIIWLDKNQWKMITITKTESPHSFPLDHTDVLQQTISYKVPPEFYDDLVLFNGSISIDRTQGTISARCDHEANNILTLNLANDIVTGKKTVEEARKACANILIEKMLGGNPEYMQKLNFLQQDDANESDMNTTGLTREGLVRISRLSRN
jgi:hypothetical protein